MSKINYHCNNCQTDFIGDDYTIKCSNCASANIVVQTREKVKSKGATKKSSNTIIWVLGAVLLVLLMAGGYYYMIPSTKKPVVNQPESLKTVSYNAEIKEERGDYFLVLTKEEGIKNLPIKLSEVKELKVSQTSGFSLNAETGLISFCEDGAGFRYVDVVLKDGNQVSTNTLEFKWREGSNSSKSCKASEAMVLLNRDIVLTVEDCTLKVNIEKFNDEDWAKTEVSFTGPDGNYIERNYALAKNLPNRHDVWVRNPALTEPVAAYNNGEEISQICLIEKKAVDKKTNEAVKSVSSAEKKALKEELIKNWLLEIENYANRFASNPDDVEAQIKLKSLLLNTLSNPPKIYLDSELLGDFSDLETEIMMSALQKQEIALSQKPKNLDQQWEIHFTKQ